VRILICNIFVFKEFYGIRIMQKNWDDFVKKIVAKRKEQSSKLVDMNEIVDS